METIYATREDGIKVTYEGQDLSGIWATVESDSLYVTGDYYVPSKKTPSKKTLKAYFGNITTTLPIS